MLISELTQTMLLEWVARTVYDVWISVFLGQRSVLVVKLASVIALFHLAACSTLGMIGDITDEPHSIEVNHPITLATTRFRNGDIFAYLNGMQPTYIASVSPKPNTYSIRDRWALPGSGLDQARAQFHLQPIEKTERQSGCKKRAVILVHGYWTLMSESLSNADWIAKLAGGGSDNDQGADVYVLLWPSGSFLDDWTYKWSTIVSRRTRRNLEQLIRKVQECHDPGNISIVAHSKGAHMVVTLFEDHQTVPGRSFDKLVLVAPDHSRSDFWSNAHNVAAQFKDVYIYTAELDPIVCLGSLFDIGYRGSLGFSGVKPNSAPQNIHLVVVPLDHSGVKYPMRVHSNYIWNRLARNDVSAVLAEGRSYACRAATGNFEYLEKPKCQAPIEIPPPPNDEATSLDPEQAGEGLLGVFARVASTLTCSIPGEVRAEFNVPE